MASPLVEAASTLIEASAEHASAAMSSEQLQSLLDTLAAILNDSFERRTQYEESAAADRTGDDDDDEDDSIPQDEENLLSTVVECLGQGLKAYHSAFLQLMQPRILAFVQKLIEPTRSASDRTAAICVFDDIIE
jgi:hypothetical protein